MNNVKKLAFRFTIVFVLAFTMTFVVACATFNSSNPIVIVTRDATSGTRVALFQFLGIMDNNFVGSNHTIQQASGAPAVIFHVAHNPQAIGYEGLQFTNASGVRTLSIDGVAPTTENVLNQKYSLSRPLSVFYNTNVVNHNGDRHVWLFHQFMRSIQAQQIIIDAGYTSFRTAGGGGDNQAINFVAEQGVRGNVNISGSTTVTPLMQRLEEEFERLQPGINVIVTGGGSNASLLDVSNGRSHFGMFSAAVTDAQFDTMANNGLSRENASNMIIALDALAFVVHSSNPMINITTAQLRHIFDSTSGTQFGNWDQLKAYKLESEGHANSAVAYDGNQRGMIPPYRSVR